MPSLLFNAQLINEIGTRHKSSAQLLNEKGVPARDHPCNCKKRRKFNDDVEKFHPVYPPTYIFTTLCNKAFRFLSRCVYWERGVSKGGGNCDIKGVRPPR